MDPPVSQALEPDEGTKALMLASADAAFVAATGFPPPARPPQQPTENWWDYFVRVLKLYLQAAAPIIIDPIPPGLP